MYGKNLKTLLGKLNNHCASAFESGASFAVTRGHYEVTVEHVVIKLLEEGGGDFDLVLHACETDMDELWQGMLQNLSRLRSGNQGKPVFSVHLAQWLEQAWIATSLFYGGPEIRSAALLESLSDLAPVLPGSQAFAPLERISPQQVREVFSRRSSGSVESAALPRPGASPKNQTGVAGASEGSAGALDQFTIDLTERARRGEIDPVLGRNQEIRLLLDILARRRKNNPIVVGEPGVGKTAVVEGLALRIAEGTVPDSLQSVRLLALDLGLLQAGAGVKGEFEKRLKTLIDEVKVSASPVILFVDEAHTLIGAGGEAGMGDAANLFKPALARGELRTIAATTWSEYKKYFERDAALARRFQLVKIEEPGEEGAVAMLSGLKDLYQQHHGILITDDAIEAAVRLSSRYIQGRQLPDKAIDLIDTAAARVCMGQAAVPALIETDREHIAYLERRLLHLAEEERSGLPPKEKLLETLSQELETTSRNLAALEERWSAETEMVSRLQQERQILLADEGGESEKRKLRETTSGVLEQLRTYQGENPLVQPEVNGDAVAEVVSDWTGVPVGKMLRDELAGLLRFEEIVGQRVVGQGRSIAAIGESIRSAKAGLRAPDAPLGVFLLAGPSGVGKTETARAIAEQLFGGERFLVTINMSEYQEAHTVSQLKGSPPGYVGYGVGGVLTEAVRQRPYSVILLDEVEKAHPDVMNLFYQVFDRGFMRDGEGREIDFKNTVILMTTNLGAEEVSTLCTPPDRDFPDQEETMEGKEGESFESVPWTMPSLREVTEAIRPALMRHFAPALVARMQIIPFLPLDGDSLQNIVAIKLDQVAQRLKEVHGIEFRCAPEVLSRLGAECSSSLTGARFVNSMIEQQLLPGISRSLLEFMAEDDLPDILSLELGEEGEISCLFADCALDVASEERLLKCAN